MRYSLRTLLIVVLVLGAFVGWLGIRLLRIRRQHEAVQTVKDAGGAVTTSRQSAGPDPFAGEPSAPPNPIAKAMDKLEAPQWFRELVGAEGFDRIKSVNLSRSPVTDADLVHLRELPNLQTLFLSDTEIGELGLQNVGRLPELETLAINGTRITDDCLIHLNNFPKL